MCGLLKDYLSGQKKAGVGEEIKRPYSSSFNTKSRGHLKKLLCNCLKVNGSNSTEHKNFRKTHKMLSFISMTVYSSNRLFIITKTHQLN